MGWSNSLPPQIQTLQDGTTQFNGPIVVTDPNGNSVASIGSNGAISGTTGAFGALTLGGNDLQTILNTIPQGVIADFALSIDGQTINNTTPCLVAITNVFATDASRRYEFISSSFRFNNGTSGNLYAVQLVLYNAYPTAANYGTYTVLAGTTISTDATTPDLMVPELYCEGPIATNSVNYLGLLITRLLGAANGVIKSSSSSFRMSVKDTGPAKNFSVGRYDPIPYVPGTPPPPPAQSNNVNYGATWSRSYDQNGNPYTNNGVETPYMYQGNFDSLHGISHSAWNFDYATIGANLNGATNISGTLFIHCDHSYNGGGMTAVVYSQNTRSGSAPGSWAGVVGLTQQYVVPTPNPGWFSIDISSLLPAFASNTLTGFAFAISSTDLQYYGYCEGATQGLNPFINVKWTK